MRFLPQVGRSPRVAERRIQGGIIRQILASKVTCLEIEGAVSDDRQLHNCTLDEVPLFPLVESHPEGSCAHVDARGMRWLPSDPYLPPPLPRHTSHARPSPRSIAAHKHARGHYLIVPLRRDNVDKTFFHGFIKV